MNPRRTLRDARVLVTGGAGFIGSHLVDRLIAEGAQELVVIDNLFLGTPLNLEDAMKTGRLVFYRDDAEFAATLDYILGKHQIDVVFNCATKALNYSFVNPSNAFSTNVTVVLNLLEAQRRAQFQTLCHVSSSEIYGTAVYEPMDEQHPVNPTTTYAAGKAAADFAVESYVRMFELDAYIVRPFNNYGPRQNSTEPLAGIIPRTICRILNGTPPEIHGDGLQSRDFIHVDDTVDAIVRLYEKMPSGESVNIASNGKASAKDIIELICRAMGYTGDILRKSGRPSDVLCHNASNAKLTGLVGMSFLSLEDGLRQTIEWYRSQRATGSNGALTGQ